MKLEAEHFIMPFITQQWTLFPIAYSRGENEGNACWILSNMMVQDITNDPGIPLILDFQKLKAYFAYAYIYFYTYIHLCVCVCVCMKNLFYFLHTLHMPYILLSQPLLVIAEVRCTKWTFHLNAAQSSDVTWKMVCSASVLWET